MKAYRAMSFEEFNKYLAGQVIEGRATPYAQSTASGVCFVPAETSVFPLQRGLTFCKQDMPIIFDCIKNDNECFFTQVAAPTEVESCFAENNLKHDIIVEFEVEEKSTKMNYGIYANHHQNMLDYEYYMSEPNMHFILMPEINMESYSLQTASALRFTCLDSMPLSSGVETAVWFSVDDYENYMENGMENLTEAFVWDKKTAGLVSYDYDAEIQCPIHGDYSVFNYSSDVYGDFELDSSEVHDSYWEYDGEEECYEEEYYEEEDAEL